MDSQRNFDLVRGGGVFEAEHLLDARDSSFDDFGASFIDCGRAAEHLARVILFFSCIDDRRFLLLQEIHARMQQNHHYKDIHPGNEKAIQRRIYRDARQAMETALCLGLAMKLERHGRQMAVKWDGPRLSLVG